MIMLSIRLHKEKYLYRTWKRISTGYLYVASKGAKIVVVYIGISNLVNWKFISF